MILKKAIASLLGLTLCGWACAQVDGYEPFTNWEQISWSKLGTQTLLFSSYDRTGENLDFNYYLDPEGYQDQVLSGLTSVSYQGPGVVRRFWMPHRTANLGYDLKITLDGSVIFDTNTDDYLQGDVGYVNTDLTQTLLGGQTSYEPLVFQKSLLVETSNNGTGQFTNTRHYYQFNVQQLPSQAKVTPTTGTLTAGQQSSRNAAVTKLVNLGDNPAGTPIGVMTTGPATTTIGPAGLGLANLTGPGMVRAIRLDMTGATEADLDEIRLVVQYDGASGIAIDVPLSYFFGVGAGRSPYKSYPLGVADDGSFYCYWPMPFRESISIALISSAGVKTITSAEVEYELGPVPPQAGYLHAVYNEETTTLGQATHQLLDVQGKKGHYVGNMLWVELPSGRRNILEGDDLITVDGEPLHLGTGMEDAYNGGYFYNHVVVQTDSGDIPNPESGAGAFAGLLRFDFDTLGDPNTRADQYRWLIPDPVVFNDSINVKVENYLEAGNIQFGSTAFYYIIDALEGDTDGDGVVGPGDYAFVLSRIENPATLGDWAEGDLTNDGWVGAGDLQLVLDKWTSDQPKPLLPAEYRPQGVVSEIAFARLSFEAQADKCYLVQCSDDGRRWTSVKRIEGQTGTVHVANEVEIDKSKLYRVVVQ